MLKYSDLSMILLFGNTGCYNSRLSIAKEWKRRATANSKGFKGIGCLFFCRALTKYNCTKCTTTTSTT